ncbi:restriction endonuclease subunit S, partial [Synechocystis salina LEGE 06155]|nr:restriction endonuclease subunit S [Synechocystis salina LEGE 06155]
NVSEDGKIDCALKRKICDLYQGFTFFAKNDVIVAKITPCFENGKGAFLNNLETDIGFGSTEFHVLRSQSFSNSSFLYYLVKSEVFMQLGEAFMVGAAGQKRVPTDFVSNFYIGFPPLEEQGAIAAFLDCKTAEIDELIAQKERLIELYEEEKTAIINEAVTKGINPDVKLKPSGIDWLGDIPEHWEVKKLKYACQLETGHTPSRSNQEYWISGECTIPWVSLNDTKTLASEDYISDTKYKISLKGMENSSAHLIDKDSVVFTRDATIGLAAIMTKEMAVSQHIIAWVCPPNIHNYYLLNIIYTMKEELESRTMGSTLKTIGMADLKRLTISVPPLEEQIKISEYIKRQKLIFDAKIAKTKRIIELQKEYRTALISEAVTGKIKVPQHP